MNELFTPVKRLSKIGDLLLLGVRTHYQFYEELTSGIAEFNVHSFDSKVDVAKWLEGLSKEKLPIAIVISNELLAADNFNIVKLLRSNPLLRDTPILALRTKDAPICKATLLKLGVNDCYEMPLTWPFLRERLAFIKRIKAKSNYLQQPPATPALSSVRVSLPKRIFDIVFSLFALILLSPVLLLIAVAIKLESKGPIIYRSKRVGRGYQVFDFYKFRSMYKDADQRLRNLEHLNQYGGAQEGGFVKIKNDPRITKVGKIIRKTSLDELPQLLNVLKGDMSIVGNRPLPLYEARTLVRENWAHRFLAPAGLTGLWQVTKRGKDTMSAKERVELDITYAMEHSFWFDLKILARTLPAMIQEENV